MKTTLRDIGRICARVFGSIFLLILGFEGMVAAFRLLNEPSDRAVYEGMAFLALLAILLPCVFVVLFRRTR